MIDHTDAALLDSVAAHEGYRAHPYRCTDGARLAGALAIGYGHNIDAHPPHPNTLARWQAAGLDDGEGRRLLEDDLRGAVAFARSYPWWPSIPDAAQRVVVEMIFQLGAHGFDRFRRTIWHLAAADFRAAAEEMRSSKWAREDTPRRAETLAARLEALA